MNLGTLSAALGLAAALAVASTASAQAELTPVEVRRSGEGGQMLIVERAIEAGFVRSPDFRLARPPQKPVMTVWLAAPVRSAPGQRIETRVAFGHGDHVFGQETISCPANRVRVCGDLTATLALDHRQAAERRPR
ncbi:hypothetical protein [Caulobacter mirabilis]|uniref:Uncharacterized protein n=1 Tax=Caulobacter mirabilis TaxID=69666 RepID=A0A2D2AUY1_9CAUL|nr:hypothetical protein [Caulobacter mirabilis]ATQ41832.1 hypothetical protein CSW64_05095 [Caulobacter mirabilis]